jgi:hypothetical protein
MLQIVDGVLRKRLLGWIHTMGERITCACPGGCVPSGRSCVFRVVSFVLPK